MILKNTQPGDAVFCGDDQVGSVVRVNTSIVVRFLNGVEWLWESEKYFSRSSLPVPDYLIRKVPGLGRTLTIQARPSSVDCSKPRPRLESGPLLNSLQQAFKQHGLA